MFGFAHGGCIKSTAGFMRRNCLFVFVGKFEMHFKSLMCALLVWQLPKSTENRKRFNFMPFDYTNTYGVNAVSRWLRPGEFAPA